MSYTLVVDKCIVGKKESRTSKAGNERKWIKLISEGVEFECFSASIDLTALPDYTPLAITATVTPQKWGNSQVLEVVGLSVVNLLEVQSGAIREKEGGEKK